MRINKERKLDVLLTDGHDKHTYAILRTLTEKKLRVGIIFHKKLSLSYYSKLVSKKFQVNSQIFKDESIYLRELLNILKNNQIDVLLPVGNISNNIISKNKSQLTKYTNIPIVDYKTIHIAQYKNETFSLANSVGIPIPKTWSITKLSDINTVINEIQFPCVIKKVNPHETGVIYCNNKVELKNKFKEYCGSLKKYQEYPIIQEYIYGKGAGFYALYDNGKCKAFFMHERIHEFPITGGASTFAMSIYDKELKMLGEKLLDKLKWHGVAMVEFKKDNEGNYKLMEINSKFWGSLELSYVAGINFPYLDYLVALGKKIPPSSYNKNVYFRWIFPHDFLWKMVSSRKERKKFKQIKKEHKIHNNLHFDDPLTILFNLVFTMYKIFKEKKYPHGKIHK